MATIKDVAKLAGVSISTVSKYLNGGNIRPENVEPIRSAIAQLDYRANPYARGLKSNRSGSVGVLLPSMTLHFFGTIINSLDKVLRSCGYHTIICCYGSDHGLERDYLRFMLDNGIDGMIYVPENLTSEEFDELTSHRRIPIVQVDRLIQGISSDAVLADNTDASYQAVSHLIENGHQRIALISGLSSIFTAKERMVGYLRALSDHKLPYDDALVLSGTYSFTTGYQSFQTLMALPDPPTAIFCVNYDIALGVITAAQERGIHIPRELTVFSYDCVEICTLMNPSIPVVHQPEAAMGQAAGTYLLERMNGYDGPPRISRLKSEILY